MVDCGNARCAQDRRLFRKELMTWSKKIPLLVGLETIAERLAGEYSSDLFQPWNDLEPQESEDWKAEDSCFYCMKKLKFLFESVNELSEEDVGNTTQEGLGLGYLNELLPYCSQYYTTSSDTLDTDQPLDLSATGSRSPSQSTDGDMGASANKNHVELKIPQIRSQKFRKEGFLNGKRAYTEEELVAAVGDIRSGKLGTRRAAALYGIPRSTLRNKIFKMETEVGGDNEEEGSIEDVSPSHPPDVGETGDSRKMSLSELMQSTPFLLMPPVPFHLPVPLDPHSSIGLENVWNWHLEHIRRKHNLNGLKEQEEFRAMCGLDSEAGNYPLHGAEESLGSPSTASLSPSQSNKEIKATILPELVRRLTEHRVEIERCTGLPQQSTCDSMSSASGSPTSNVAPLKIPSFKPSLGASSEESKKTDDIKERNAYECGKIGDTLKDIIAKTIAEKVRTRTHYCSNPSADAVPIGNVSVGSPPSAFSIPSASPAKRSRKQPCPQSTRKISPAESNSNGGKENTTSTTSQNGSTSATTPVKKTRPKRGQYRKYNSQLLMEAVKAVQRGEMSVHRAGSYFGVPHSTLEYKVKERHLLRQKKIKENQSAKQGSAGATNTSETKKSTSNTQKQKKSDSISKASNGTSEKAEASNSLIKFDPSHSLSTWLHPPPPNGLPYPSSLGLQTSPFTANFAISTPASELLKKLQQKVQNKSHSFCPDEAFLSNGFPRANGSSLQDGFLFIK